MANATDKPVESAPEAAATESQEAADTPTEDTETVTLAVAGLGLNITGLRVPQEDGSMLVFDERGTEVPAEDADALIETAALSGVALYRKDA